MSKKLLFQWLLSLVLVLQYGIAIPCVCGDENHNKLFLQEAPKPQSSQLAGHEPHHQHPPEHLGSEGIPHDHSVPQDQQERDNHRCFCNPHAPFTMPKSSALSPRFEVKNPFPILVTFSWLPGNPHTSFFLSPKQSAQGPPPLIPLYLSNSSGRVCT